MLAEEAEASGFPGLETNYLSQIVRTGPTGPHVFSLASVALTKHHDGKQLGKERVCLAYTYVSIAQGSQGRN